MRGFSEQFHSGMVPAYQQEKKNSRAYAYFLVVLHGQIYKTWHIPPRCTSDGCKTHSFHGAMLTFCYLFCYFNLDLDLDLDLDVHSEQSMHENTS